MTPIQIRNAETDDIPVVKELFQAYADELGVDLAFQGFAEEIRLLPGAYSAPGGVLLLALMDGVVGGCVAMRTLNTTSCEMKRLFVRAPWRSFGMGRRLVAAVIAEACDAGYQYMCLDTLAAMSAAQSLYCGFGFKPISAYYNNPIPNTLYLQLDLKQAPENLFDEVKYR